VSELILSEPTFRSYETHWYGDRYFFQSSSLWKKGCLEVTYLRDLNVYTYRYISSIGFFLSCKSGPHLPVHDESIPFWVRKIFFHFTKSSYHTLKK